ncbi:hypothetical protein STEG23_021423 [Scotinomys teguina]
MQLWAVTRTWPIPMPVHANSTNLPTLFSTSCDMEAPCLLPKRMEERIFNLSRINLKGVFCFDLKDNSPCIQLRHKNITAWMDPLENALVPTGILNNVLRQVSSGSTEGSGVTDNSTSINVTTMMMRSLSLVPLVKYNSTINGTKFLASPFCKPDFAFPPIFTACQGRTWEWRQISKGFSLSPSIKRHLLDSKRNGSSSGDGWPWFQWLISNEAGAVSDISALAQLGGIEHHLVNISGNLTDHKGDRRLSHIKENGELLNVILPEAAVCVQSPFVFLLTNATPIDNLVDCFNDSCLLAECWNGTWTLAVIVKVPTFVPIPVESDPKTFPIMTLLRERRDFGITAAIVAAIVLSAASAVTAAVAVTNQIQTAQTINTVVAQTSAVMETQHRINKHLMSGIVAANQRMDLIQTQVEELFGLVQIGCIAKLKHMCVTPLRFGEARNKSKMIASYLTGNWTRDAELLMSQQLLQIVALNKTRVEPISLGDFTDWLSSAFSFFKEWVGVGIFGAICCLGMFLCLWFLCRLRA